MGSKNFKNLIFQNSLVQNKKSLLHDVLYAKPLPSKPLSYPQPPSAYIAVFDWCEPAETDCRESLQRKPAETAAETKESKRTKKIQKNPKDSKRIQKIPKDSKRIQKIP